jgi:hypothetical protein
MGKHTGAVTNAHLTDKWWKENMPKSWDSTGVGQQLRIYDAAIKKLDSAGVLDVQLNKHDVQASLANRPREEKLASEAWKALQKARDLVGSSLKKSKLEGDEKKLMENLKAVMDTRYQYIRMLESYLAPNHSAQHAALMKK